MTTPWKPARVWKGKECLIELDASGDAANLWKDPALGFPAFEVVDPASAVAYSVNGHTVVHTDSRFVADMDHHFVRYMREGVMSGLEDNASALPGRFIICKAIGLAVHLGASRICLKGTEAVTARALRNLATMVRPLKGRRVYVYEPAGLTGLFPNE